MFTWFEAKIKFILMKNKTNFAPTFPAFYCNDKFGGILGCTE